MIQHAFPANNWLMKRSLTIGAPRDLRSLVASCCFTSRAAEHSVRRPTSALPLIVGQRGELAARCGRLTGSHTSGWSARRERGPIAHNHIDDGCISQI